MRRLSWLLFLSLACGGAIAGSAVAADHAITVTSFSTFSPDDLTINVGDRVTWTYAGGVQHNVVADDNSFRCAKGCDDQPGGNGNLSGDAWSATRTFNSPGSIRYYCALHGAPGGVGMAGIIRVAAAGDPGTLAFALANPSVSEGAGSVLVGVTRTGGAQGAVSVQYATSNGSATSGSDYTPASGTLNWPNGDGAAKSFPVPILNDTTSEPAETVQLTLSNPTGGATAGGAATLTILDDDAAAGPGVVQFSSPIYLGREGQVATLVITRTGGTAGSVGVSIGHAGGSASPGTDFTEPAASLAFAGGAGGEKSVTVPLLADDLVEGTETALFALSGATGGATLGPRATATLSIRDANLGPDDVTPEEELCEERRLGGLLAKLRASGPGTTKKVGLNVASHGEGDFFGLATTGNGPLTPESHLWFSGHPGESELRRDPKNPLATATSLARNDLNSDLVAKTSPDRLFLSLNPGKAPNPAAAALLTIDNLAPPNGVPSAARADRLIRPLFEPCTDKLTHRDRHLLAVLAKLARAAATAQRSSIALYRGEGADRYRIDVYPLNPSGQPILGRLAIELLVTFGSGDELVGGTLSILPRCTAGATNGCTSSGAAGLDLIKAVKSGVLAPAPAVRVFTAGTDGSGQPSASFDWRDVLGGTSWLDPL